MKHARIINGIAVDVTAFDPATQFHPDIAAQFVPVPSEVVEGSRQADGSWFLPQVAPEPGPPPAPPRRTKVNRTEYYGMFTAIEEAMIRIAASEEVTLAKLGAANTAEKQRLMAVAALQVMLRRTDQLAPTDTLELSHPQVQEGLGLLVAMGLLTGPRKTEIETGVPA